MGLRAGRRPGDDLVRAVVRQLSSAAVFAYGVLLGAARDSCAGCLPERIRAGDVRARPRQVFSTERAV